MNRAANMTRTAHQEIDGKTHVQPLYDGWSTAAPQMDWKNGWQKQCTISHSEARLGF